MYKKTFLSKGLLGRSLRGGAALAMGTILERLARFVRNMILARILAPDQFGISAIVIACSAFFEAVTDVGTGQSIIQNKAGDNKEYLNSVWWFNVARGTALFTAGFFAAPLFAWFYKDPNLTAYLRVAFLTMFWNGLTSTGMYAKQRDLKFGTTVWVTQGSGLIGTIVTLCLAIFVKNVWVLVIGVVCEGMFRCILSFILCPIKPHLPIDKAASKDLSRFSRGMAGLPIFTFLVLQADVFVLGRVSSKEVLGMYFLALSLANMPVMIFNKIANPLLLPVFARLQNDLQKLSSYLMKVTRLILMFGLPMATCMAVFASPILTVVFGAKYAVMALPFSILCYYFIFFMTGAPLASIYLAVGQPALHRSFTILRLALVGSLIYPAALFLGPAGVASCLLLCFSLATILQIYNMGKIIHLPPGKYLGSIKSGAFSASIALVLGLLFKNFVNVPPIASVGASVFICLLVWTISILMNRANLRTALNPESNNSSIKEP